MSQSLAQIYVHIVFSTKNRNAFLKDRAIRKEMHDFLAGMCRRFDCPALRVGGVEDHVHLLVRLGRKTSIADLVKEIKHDSSSWIKTRSPDLAAFYWQAGYGAFSVSPAHVDGL